MHIVAILIEIRDYMHISHEQIDVMVFIGEGKARDMEKYVNLN